jgi:hypothetical protein
MASPWLSGSTQRSARVAERRLPPAEPGPAAMAQADGPRLAYCHRRIPHRPTEEGLRCATPLLLFPASISQALSVSEPHKRPSYPSPKGKIKNPEPPRQLYQLFSLTNNSILLSAAAANHSRQMNSAGGHNFTIRRRPASSVALVRRLKSVARRARVNGQNVVSLAKPGKRTASARRKIGVAQRATWARVPRRRGNVPLTS